MPLAVLIPTHHTLFITSPYFLLFMALAQFLRPLQALSHHRGLSKKQCQL